ncbi:hypothetical protein EJ02DRAFT_468694 [Clathrospora elynae]|uniref:Uncharacterized protein n=1 Tax=Clathrospora elynae TaxID=706981 RepID=A0A6A5SF95_9PLEO|nr:hypothetical protein EJ02DRAFT_468694 [Clathrospora elynae]
MWSLRKGREADRKQEKEDAKIQKQLELEQRRDEREILKKEREKEKKATEKQHQKAEKEATKYGQATQQLKIKAPQSVPPNNKCQKQSVGSALKVAVPEAAPSPPLRITSRGRNVTLPSKFR